MRKSWSLSDRDRIHSDADAKLGILSWAESLSLHRWSAKYCPLLPPPRSTIAAAFSPDGKSLASTHGDHTVKIMDCHTGKCVKVLSGHRRTPWVVRYHPLHSDILASGSLDHEVRLWDANTSDCIGSQDFHRPIASIAFHGRGEILAVASGHKLYIWNYNKRDDASVPTIILRTRRSLRAVHFHPHGAPYLLTAEVNNIESADSPLTLARSSGYSNYPSALLVSNTNSRFCPLPESNVTSPCLLWPAYLRDDGILHVLGNASSSTIVQQRSSLVQPSTSDTANLQLEQFATPMDVCPGEPTSFNNISDAVTVPTSNAIEMHGAGGQSNPRLQGSSSISNLERFSARDALQVSSLSSIEPIPSTAGSSGSNSRRAMPLNMLLTGGLDVQMFQRNVGSGQQDHFLFGDSSNWEVPFVQGFLMTQNHTGLHPALVNNNVLEDLSGAGTAGINNSTRESSHMHNFGRPGASSSIPLTSGSSRRPNRHYASRSVPGVGSLLLVGPQIDEAEAHAASLGAGSEITASMLAPGTELPCTVKLRIWRHDINEPCVPLAPEACRLTISHAVLCSEMGAHFSPCGRFLVACVACLLPQTEGGRGSQLPVPYEEAGSSPTRHPLPSHRVIYELRVYSLEEETFGDILASRAIRAAHCLTSIQFSPTSEHILLAYGRRHSSLLRSIVVEGENGIPVYTILEVYRVSDMELVRVLPSAEDEVNVACFHPLPGGGLVYGTKVGSKLFNKQKDPEKDFSAGFICVIRPRENIRSISNYIRTDNSQWALSSALGTGNIGIQFTDWNRVLTSIISSYNLLKQAALQIFSAGSGALNICPVLQVGLDVQ
ncbi:Transducin family protein / WD-40 repeat family protein [Zea mays]|uniref:Transducin family protein / WD-40 repeat family protein n=1 Tax=Zea mays TaxID=4577 RepID=A0A1D6EEH4_MAIZE|nr:Transducin family protein / WD-40 repeat family protein [Zea mays]